MDKFKVGDHVRWNSAACMVSGRIIRVHHADFDYKGYRLALRRQSRNMRSGASMSPPTRTLP